MRVIHCRTDVVVNLCIDKICEQGGLLRFVIHVANAASVDSRYFASGAVRDVLPTFRFEPSLGLKRISNPDPGATQKLRASKSLDIKRCAQMVVAQQSQPCGRAGLRLALDILDNCHCTPVTPVQVPHAADLQAGKEVSQHEGGAAARAHARMSQ